MKSIGFDKNGAEHLIPENDKTGLHRTDSGCGCNPDPYCDDPVYIGQSGPARWWWAHHGLN